MMDLREYFTRINQQSTIEAAPSGPLSPAPHTVDRSTASGSSTAASNSSYKSSGSSSSLPDDLPVPPLGNVAVKREIVVKGPTQPRDCKFPRTKFSNGNLSFNPAWYDIKEAKGWLEYSEKSDKMYCFACRLFESELRERNEPNWMTIGVCNWKKALEKIKNHYRSTQHKYAESAREHFLKIDRHIDVLLDKSREEEFTRRQQEIDKNRRYLARLVDIAKTLAKCGMPFRGHNEKKDSMNRGNFLEIVDLLSRWDPVFAEYVENGARNCTYLSNRAQNDLIHAMGDLVLRNIVEDVKLAKVFTVMMDETTDVSGKEQASIMIRFVDLEDIIQERLIGLSTVSRTDSETLFKLLKDTLMSHGLNLSQVRGQCYDGASNMSGRYHGLQARVKLESPKAVYVHCYAHCLNLVLVDAMKSNKTARNFFGTLESLYCFIRQSTCRHSLFQTLQHEFEASTDDDTGRIVIKQLCETRWACRFEAIRAMEANLQVIVELLHTIEDETSQAKAAADARGLLHQFQSFEFLLAMVVLKQLLEHTNVVSQYLQSRQIDLGAAVSSIQATLSVLRRYRSEEKFHECFEAATSLAEMLGADIPTVLSTRRKRVSQRLDHMWQTEHHHETVESKYRVEFYYRVLDCMIEQIEQRFSQETQNLLVSFSYLQPEKLLKHGEEQRAESSLQKLAQFYGMNGSALKTEYSLFKESRRDCLQKCKTMLDVLQVLHQTGLHRVYGELYQLYRLFVTLPVTTASCERSFSKLTIVKNKLRSTTAQDRLENLMILFVENDITTKLNYESVIDNFASMGPRRMQLT